MEYRGAEAIYTTGFEQDADMNFDAWPDEWTRRRSEGYPQYLSIAIADDPAGETSRCLRIELDGGAATIYSAPIEINPLFSYLLQGKLKTQQLHHDVAYYSVTFFDAKREQKESYNSPELTDVPAWQEIQIGPLTPTNPQARYAVIGLHLMPTRRADLRGAALFDDIHFARLPRMSIHSPRPQNVFFDAKTVELTCSVSGIRQPNPTVRLELLDETGRGLASETLPMNVAVAAADLPATSDAPAQNAAETPPSTGHAASLTWRPPVPGNGFYTVRAALQQDDDLDLQHAVSFVVTRPVTQHSRSEFGWSLTNRVPPLALDEMLKLLELAHVSWLKCPALCDPSDQAALDQLAELADRLSTSDIELVGVLDEVPPETRKQLVGKERPSVADLFLEPTLWPSLIDPLLSRLSMRVHHWQLGSERDDCLVEVQGLEGIFRSVHQHLEQSGHRARVGLAWPWVHEVATTADAPWDFLALSESPPFTDTELDRYAMAAATPHTPHWITLGPLPRGQYAVGPRARDLVLRMLAAKSRGTTAIFVSNPFDDSLGLVNRDGTPSELFLPWCITADLVGGAEYLGSMQLPNGSHNYVFARPQEVVMVVWNETPVSEKLYLGDQVRQLDLWGRECPRPPSDSPGTTAPQTITAGPLPTFVTGLHPAIARWQVDCVLEPGQLASVSGLEQVARLRFRNTFPRHVTGSVALGVPALWEVSESKFSFRLSDNEPRDETLAVVLQANACAGSQRVRIDFDVEADRRYQFSIYRDVRVGSGDVQADFDSWLDDDGQLVVEQYLTNNSAYPLNLNCYLYAPGRRRARQQILEMAPGRATRSFVLPNGQELLGQPLWLQVEEIGGARVLNYQVIPPP
jgi:hypothetical protein